LVVALGGHAIALAMLAALEATLRADKVEAALVGAGG